MTIAWTAPKEGAAISSNYIAIGKGAPNLAASQQFLNLALSEEYQRVKAELDFNVPVNPQTKLDPAKFPITQEIVNNAKPIPWAVFNTKRTELNERWQREIESR